MMVPGGSDVTNLFDQKPLAPPFRIENTIKIRQMLEQRVEDKRKFVDEFTPTNPIARVRKEKKGKREKSRHNETHIISTVLRVQSIIRGFIARRRYYKHLYYLKEKLRAIRIQCMLRRFVARCRVRYVRRTFKIECFILRREALKKHNASLLITSWIRIYVNTKRALANEPLIKIRLKTAVKLDRRLRKKVGYNKRAEQRAIYMQKLADEDVHFLESKKPSRIRLSAGGEITSDRTFATTLHSPRSESDTGYSSRGESREGTPSPSRSGSPHAGMRRGGSHSPFKRNGSRGHHSHRRLGEDSPIDRQSMMMMSHSGSTIQSTSMASGGSFDTVGDFDDKSISPRNDEQPSLKDFLANIKSGGNGNAMPLVDSNSMEIFTAEDEMAKRIALKNKAVAFVARVNEGVVRKDAVRTCRLIPHSVSSAVVPKKKSSGPNLAALVLGGQNSAVFDSSMELDSSTSASGFLKTGSSESKGTGRNSRAKKFSQKQYAFLSSSSSQPRSLLANPNDCYVPPMRVGKGTVDLKHKSSIYDKPTASANARVTDIHKAHPVPPHTRLISVHPPVGGGKFSFGDSITTAPKPPLLQPLNLMNNVLLRSQDPGDRLTSDSVISRISSFDNTINRSRSFAVGEDGAISGRESSVNVTNNLIVLPSDPNLPFRGVPESLSSLNPKSPTFRIRDLSGIRTIVDKHHPPPPKTPQLDTLSMLRDEFHSSRNLFMNSSRDLFAKSRDSVISKDEDDPDDEIIEKAANAAMQYVNGNVTMESLQLRSILRSSMTMLPPTNT